MSAHSVAISPDGKTLASGTGNGTIRLWNLAGGGEPTIINKAHGEAVISLAFMPEGQSLISGGSRFKLLPHEVYERYGRVVSEIRFWEVSTGRLLRELQAGEPDWGSCALALSKDGKILAGAYQDKIRLWQVASGKPVRKIVRPEGWRGTRTHGLALSADGTMVAAAEDDKAAHLWDVATGNPLLENSEVHPEGIRSVSYSPDGKLVATGSYRDQTVFLWDAATGGQVRSLSFSSSSFTGSTVNALTFSRDGRFLVAGGCVRERCDELKFIGGLKTWDLATGKPVREVTLPHRVSAAAFSSDGKTLAAATWDMDRSGIKVTSNSTIYIWKAATGEGLFRLTPDNPFPYRIVAMAFSPDNINLVSVDEASDAIVWDLSTRKLDSKFTVRSGFRRAALSPNAKHVATCGFSDSTVLVWEVATGKEVSKLNVPGSIGNALAYSPDGKVLATASRGAIDTPKRYHSWIQLWDVSTGNRIAKYEAPYETASRLAFSPDGKALVSGMQNGSALVWDVTGALDKSKR